VQFDKVGGVEVNLESAVDQLERYKMLMESWCQQNVSATISYDASEVGDIIQWLYDNWDNYVGVSFLFRNDPTKTAADLGYLYLPQEVVTKAVFDEYIARIVPFELDETLVSDVLEDDCAGGACPIR
jgi:ribonucleoside-triphosphate reductase